MGDSAFFLALFRPFNCADFFYRPSNEATIPLNFLSVSLAEQETSLHGLKYVTNARTAQEKSAWVVLLIAALVAASVFVYRQENERARKDCRKCDKKGSKGGREVFWLSSQVRWEDRWTGAGGWGVE